MGPEEKAFYEQAAKRGVLKIPRVKLDAIGDEDAGKSCLGDSIIEGRSSTKGVLMKMALRTAIGLKGKWEEMGQEKFDEELDKLLARGYVGYTRSGSVVSAQEVVVRKGETLPKEAKATLQPPTSTQENRVSERERATAARPLSNSTVNQDDEVIEREQPTAVGVSESTHSNR